MFVSAKALIRSLYSDVIASGYFVAKVHQIPAATVAAAPKELG